jgi:hypothetical protein
MLAARQLISITIQDGRILEGRIMGPLFAALVSR